MRIITPLFLSACGASLGPGKFPGNPVDATFTDPDGVERTYPSALHIRRFEGPDCAAATWYEVFNSDFGVRFAVPDAGGPATFEAGETSIVRWDDQALGTPPMFLHGGTGTASSNDDTHFAYEITGAEVRYQDWDTDEDVAYPQPAPIVVRFEGAFGTFETEELDGVPSFATDADGTPLCGDPGA